MPVKGSAGAGKARTKVATAPTAHVWECPARGVLHAKRARQLGRPFDPADFRTASTIFRGPKKFFVRCPLCASTAFFGVEWDESLGMTYEQAIAQGYKVLG